MPYTKTVDENTIQYTVTTPNWYCEWIVDRLNTKKPMKRQCYLKDLILDPLNPNDRIRIDELMPEILKEIYTAIDVWALTGDVIAATLIYPHNIPAYLAYGETQVGLKN